MAQLLIDSLVAAPEAFLLEHCLKALFREAIEINPLLLPPIIIENDEVGVVVADPLHIRVLPVLPPLVMFEVLTKLGVEVLC